MPFPRKKKKQRMEYQPLVLPQISSTHLEKIEITIGELSAMGYCRGRQLLFSMARSASSDLVPLESPALSLPPAAPGTAPGVQLQQLLDGSYLPHHHQHHHHQHHQPQQQQQQSARPVSSQSAQPPSGDGSVTSSSTEIGGAGGTAAAGPEHDTYSTDSSSFEGGDVKRRRRRLHFPFGKKFSKTKKTQ